MTLARIAISAGDPAGIGPDLVLAAAQREWPAQLTLIGDSAMLRQRAAEMGVKVKIRVVADNAAPATPHSPGELCVMHEPLAVAVVPGVAAVENAAGVLAALDRTVDGCIDGVFHAMVTAPINKALICRSGVAFSGHTEYLAERTQTEQVVMLLAAGELRVALATTHIPLGAVPDAIRSDHLLGVLRVMHRELTAKFGLSTPRISVLGLNPHAGESGTIGCEDSERIAPAIASARSEGIQVTGPWPADTAFNARLRGETDAYLAMYHDQGLPVLKYASFGAAVNVTLGLPIIRTSVDHGTAYDLAASGDADPGSFEAALALAIALSG